MIRLAEILKIRPGEGRMVALLVGLMLAASAGMGMGGSGIDALFFSRFGVQYLPTMYVVLGGLTLLTMLVTSALLGGVDTRRLYISLPLILAIILAAERAVLTLDLTWFYPVIWLAKGITSSFQGLFTWGLAGALCDTRQAKRLFPLFSAGGILGTVVGSSLTPLVVSFLHSENLILVWAAALAAAFGLGWLLVGRAPAPPSSRARARQAEPGLLQQMRQGFDFVRQSPLLSLISSAALLFSIAWFSLEFPFNTAATAAFPNEDALAGFLGIFMGINTAAALLISLFLANRLFARFGIMPMIIVFPAIYTLGFGVLTFFAPFSLIAVFRFAQIGWAQGVAGTAWQAMFNVIPSQRRDQARAFIGGVSEQAGVVIAGLLLIIGQQVLQPGQVYLIGLAAAVAILVILWRATRAYRGALVEALRAGQPQVFFAEEEPFGGFAQDAQVIALLIHGVSDPDPLVRRVAIEVLANLALPQAGEALVGALIDPDPTVRMAALRALVATGSQRVILRAADCLADPDDGVRAQAAETLRAAKTPPEELLARLRALLEDPAPPVQAQAALALAGHSDQPRASRTLIALAVSQDPDVQALGLEALGALGDSDNFELVADHLIDREPGVRRAAVYALGNLPHPRRVDTLVLALADDDRLVQQAVGEALAHIGAEALGPTLAGLQLPALEDAALAALAGLRIEPVAQKIRAYAIERANDAMRYHVAWRKVPATEDDERAGLLADSLLQKARAQAIRALSALSLLGESREEMTLAVQNLLNENPDQRTNALETLEALGSYAEIVRPLIQLWEPKVPLETGSLDYVLHVLQDEDGWLRACGALAAGQIDHWEIKAALETLANSDRDPLVRETADTALTALYRGKNLDKLSVIERILYLRRVTLFASLPPADLKPIARIAEERRYADGELIVKQGDLGDRMYVLTAGEVRVLVAHGGEPGEIARRGPGEVVGEVSMISQEPRMASLVAASEVRTLTIAREPFEKLLRERPEISLAVMRVLCARISEKGASPQAV